MLYCCSELYCAQVCCVFVVFVFVVKTATQAGDLVGVERVRLKLAIGRRAKVEEECSIAKEAASADHDRSLAALAAVEADMAARLEVEDAKIKVVSPTPATSVFCSMDVWFQLRNFTLKLLIAILKHS